MKKIVIVICCVMLLISCKSIKPTETLAPLYVSEALDRNNYGLIIVNTEKQGIANDIYLKVFVDKEEGVLVRNGKMCQIRVPFGVHTVKITSNLTMNIVERQVEILKNKDCIITFRKEKPAYMFSDYFDWKYEEVKDSLK